MAGDSIYQTLLETSWRRKLTDAETAELRAWLAAHPETKADWELEARLGKALTRLPDVPVASNFTARVLETIEREEAAAGRESFGSKWRTRRWRWRWLPRAAVAGVALGIGLFSYHGVQAARRAEMARSVAAVSDVASLPSPEILKDFDTIRALSQSPPADAELLMLLK